MTNKNKALFICSLLLLSTFALPVIMLVQAQQNGLFEMTLIVPATNPSRKAWAEIIENALDEVGIDAKRVELDWDTCYSRALTPDPSVVGKTYNEGGFDALFIGYAMGVDPDPYGLFDSSQFTPDGQNYYLWDNEESDRLCRLIQETTDEATRIGYVKEWQQLYHEEEPAATIMYTKEVVVFDPTLLQPEPFSIYHYPAFPRVKNWKLTETATTTTVVLAQTGPAPEEGFNPLLTTSYYDVVAYDNCFDGLAERENLETFAMVPNLATSWSVASDGKTWTVELRDGVTWHDGVAFTADDVKFTFDSYLNPDIGSPVGSFIEGIIGAKENVEVVDANTVIFHLPKVYAYFVESILAGSIIPKHVLESVPAAEWKTHPFNTCSGSYMVGSYEAWGPIGTGPYTYEVYDPTTLSNILVKNENYWNKAALEAKGEFGIETFYVQQIEDSDPAITALKNGQVDFLDSQYQLNTKMDSLEPAWSSWVSYDAFGVQELGFNMRHPVFGTGVDTPLGKSDPSKAAEAAKYVRQAISYCIDRQGIIDTIVDGYGAPGVTTAITKVTAGYDSSIAPYSYDLEMAKSLLAAAGYDTGVAPPGGDFIGQYGLYIAVAAIVAVVAVAAVYFVKKR